MKRSALFAVVALLVFAACSSDKHSSSATTKPKTSTPSGSTKRVPPKIKATAFATARKLGCTAPKLSPVRNRLGLPRPPASVDCTASGVRYRVEVYASHAARVRLLDAASTRIRCGLVKALGGKGPVYTVDGDNFSVTATAASGKNDALAQAKALGVKLGLPVTTTTCPA